MEEVESQDDTWEYKNLAWYQEQQTHSLFCVRFNHLDPHLSNVFATVGAARATVYRCGPGNLVHILQAFKGQHEDEEYYVCEWSQHPATKEPWLLVAGKHGVLNVVNCMSGQLEASLCGHGSAINDIAVHPFHPHIVATASKDHTIRVWNLHVGRPVLICQGDGSHVNEILSLDWRVVGEEWTLVSAGMDSCVKIWDFSPHLPLITDSEDWTDPEAAYPVRLVTFPIFTAQVHGGLQYVDCVRWVGDLVLSKSVDNKALLWRADLASHNPRGIEDGRFTVVQTLKLEVCDRVWWLRFGLDGRCARLAIGTRKGNTLLYDLEGGVDEGSPRERLTPPPRPRASGRGLPLVRQAALSACATWVASAHDDGLLAVYMRKDGPRGPGRPRVHSRDGPRGSRAGSSE
ncbi:hypothetical protein ACKKBF_B02455 [Auxenochlorella protothecoides x Auxenochlorella symbiontica]